MFTVITNARSVIASRPRKWRSGRSTLKTWGSLTYIRGCHRFASPEVATSLPRAPPGGALGEIMDKFIRLFGNIEAVWFELTPPQKIAVSIAAGAVFLATALMVG